MIMADSLDPCNTRTYHLAATAKSAHPVIEDATNPDFKIAGHYLGIDPNRGPIARCADVFAHLIGVMVVDRVSVEDVLS